MFFYPYGTQMKDKRGRDGESMLDLMVKIMWIIDD